MTGRDAVVSHAALVLLGGLLLLLAFEQQRGATAGWIVGGVLAVIGLRGLIHAAIDALRGGGRRGRDERAA